MSVAPPITPNGTPPLRIAILLNSYRSPFIAEIRDSYIRTLSHTPHHLTFYYPAEDATSFPDPALFDLIVIGGGNADPRKRHPWILRVHRFILEVVEKWPGKKILGICWGHQTICMLFGSGIEDMEGPEVSSFKFPLFSVFGFREGERKGGKGWARNGANRDRWESRMRDSHPQGHASWREVQERMESSSYSNIIDAE
jgi:glucosinolate gamma-glutamyl hydrolase